MNLRKNPFCVKISIEKLELGLRAKGIKEFFVRFLLRFCNCEIVFNFF